MVICGNSLNVLKTLEANSIDSVVTDPPYGLSFMGKKWDYDVPSTELWAEVFRVLKPGGHLLAFAGTRTQHRMAVNIEDAGFEIRDMIAWVYGSGFPKSLNIGKAVDKLQGNERKVVGTISSQDITSGGLVHKKYSRVNVDVTKGNSPYEGWGTALKPALEPITVARKPIKGTVANNVLEHGTGGINIDGCRVGIEEITVNRHEGQSNSLVASTKGRWKGKQEIVTGRFPANFIHDGSDEVVGLLGEPARFFYTAKASKSERNKGLEGFDTRNVNDGRVTSIDNAFQRGDTQRANTHPTVKPIKLMQYLVRLVTPKGGTVLDPFNGSGTTGIACKLEGMEYIGIELDPDYVKISEARIAAWEAEPQLSLVEV